MVMWTSKHSGLAHPMALPYLSLKLLRSCALPECLTLKVKRGVSANHIAPFCGEKGSNSNLFHDIDQNKGPYYTVQRCTLYSHISYYSS
jgi:hypothetical protein